MMTAMSIQGLEEAVAMMTPGQVEVQLVTMEDALARAIELGAPGGWYNRTTYQRERLVAVTLAYAEACDMLAAIDLGAYAELVGARRSESTRKAA